MSTSPPWSRWLATITAERPDRAEAVRRAATRLQRSSQNAEDGTPTPGAEAVVTALTDPEADDDAVTHALTVFAWERVATGDDLTCTMDDLDELWTAVERTAPTPVSRSRARHCLVDAWAEAIAAERGSPGVDPLSGLHTAGYLYGRVHELDRVSGDSATPLVLLVVRWDAAAGPWQRIARIMQVASALRARVRPEATLSQVGTTMAVALVPDDARARLERLALTKAVGHDELSTAQVQVDVFAVPDTRSRLPDLVTQLHETANVDQVAGSPASRHTGAGPLD
ncbi:hypothetical protein [Haloactinopolyspora alba]|uniref:hypothetical protein n=1 Tax=Haloactinopolyspora alba TaxID=648780 RepID=UPI000D0DB8E8|nr:hypothetical protein [Haloactinopolyspora alba]